ncbi:2Fe-2S iron-sulfur cluster binding domain-containing protein [Shimia gijangensis]|uniref:2Fe-2S iron-sulfur cluster binding domain-containing protein n=1 Tax=Shimia gijangensis TaxID=1470563 RepID=A0A1M6RYJ9_9RHOB|nr:(2Fe-2S)-binding protein [Shimia gijangensis]SHK37585.1 2Fe-2S iron-sulfur cluster binding domain-containing protein [Shimia gijangensis]
MTVSRFTRRNEAIQDIISFSLDGQPASACAGDTVAAALLAHDSAAFRHTGIHSSPRTPFCMMGICFDCLVTIDGVQNQQACMITVTVGMDIRRQAGFRKLEGRS